VSPASAKAAEHALLMRVAAAGWIKSRDGEIRAAQRAHPIAAARPSALGAAGKRLGLPLGCKQRPSTGLYDTFKRNNVTPAALRKSAIRAVSEGLDNEQRRHPLDVLKLRPTNGFAGTEARAASPPLGVVALVATTTGNDCRKCALDRTTTADVDHYFDASPGMGRGIGGGLIDRFSWSPGPDCSVSLDRPARAPGGQDNEATSPMPGWKSTD